MIRISRAVLFGIVVMGVLVGGCASRSIQDGEANKAQEYMREANRYAAAKQYREALAAYTAEIDALYKAEDVLLNYSVLMKQAYTNRAWMKYNLNDVNGALKDARHAVEMYPNADFPLSWLVYGVIQITLGNRDGALLAVHQLEVLDRRLARDLAERIAESN